MRRPGDWTEAEILEALDMVERRGMTAKQAGEHFGRSRMAVIGVIHRVNTETDKHDITPHLNGTMPQRWWEEGLKNAAQ